MRRSRLLSTGAILALLTGIGFVSYPAHAGPTIHTTLDPAQVKAFIDYQPMTYHDF